MRWFSQHQVNREWKQLLGLVALAALLYGAAGVGMAYVAGFGAVHRRLQAAHWWWLGPSVAAVLIAYAGYYVAYEGINTAEDGPRLGKKSLLAVVTAGFGGFLAHGGSALDEFAMRAGGADKREAKVRVGALAGFEHGCLAFIACPAAIIALAVGLEIPRRDFSWPWAVIPPIGFALAIWSAKRYGDRFRHRDGWRGILGTFLDAVDLVETILRHPRRYAGEVAGMLVYWGGDIFALWAATTAFGYQMSGLAVIVAYGSGMVLTRRTAPLGGAGLLTVALVPTLWYGAAVPFAAATLGVAFYRFFTLWLPLPGSFAALPALRALGEKAAETPGQGTSTTKGEPALQH